MVTRIHPKRRLRFAWILALPLIFAGTASAEMKDRFSGINVPFIANSGQTDPAVAYYAKTFAGTVFVTKDGRIVYSLPGKKAATSRQRSGWSLTETPVGGKAIPIGKQRTATNVSYFIGNDRSLWKSGLETFEGVSLGEVWQGIHLELRARGKNVEKLFTLNPDGDPSRIRMRVNGTLSLRTNAEGALVARTDLGEIALTPPRAFQDLQGVRHLVQVAYRLRGKEYGFRLGDYDHTLPVLIDPLIQATYLGGSVEDVANALAIHPTSGDVYVAGSTGSMDFPGTTGGAQRFKGGSPGTSDAFVARLNSSLTVLNQVTYLGGSGGDGASALAIHPTSGDVYIAGSTGSRDFPGTSGGPQATNPSNGSAAFLVRLNSSLTTLIQATYLGGSNYEAAYALAIHPASSDVYVAGYTASPDLHGREGGAQAAYGGGVDAFVARLSSSLKTLYQTTYLGGSDFDVAYALAIDPTSGDAYVAGSTSSISFPAKAGGAQAVYAGSGDVFVARLNSTLTSLVQATYLGGGGEEVAYAVEIHPISRDVYVAGYTWSMNFPGTAGGAQPAHAPDRGGGVLDGFVARLNFSLTTLFQATYLGGSAFIQGTNLGGGNDIAYALAIHPASGEVYVAGSTASSDFPGTPGAAQEASGRSDDAFVARLDSSLTNLNQATYLGGAGAEGGNALAINPTSGDVYVAGSTTSSNLPQTTNGAQPEHGADRPYGNDAFVARLTAGLGAGPCVADVTSLCLNGGRFKVQTRWTTPDGATGLGQAVALTANTGYFTFFSPNNVEVIVKAVSACGFNSRVWTFTAGLTDINVVMTVIDTVTGEVKTYVNPQGTAFAPIQDTSAFAACSTTPDTGLSHAPEPNENLESVAIATTESSAVCTADATTLCLNGGRFKVQTQWTTADGKGGAGQATGMTADTGSFWFFSPNNVEVIAKVVSGCGFNSRYWTFAGGLTDVNVVMTVTDTKTGVVRTYINPQGLAFQPIQDTSSFATCP